MKKLIALLLAVVVILTTMVAPVFAGDGKGTVAEKQETLKTIQADTRVDMATLNSLNLQIRTALTEARAAAGWIALTEDEKEALKSYMIELKALNTERAGLLAELKKGWADLDKEKFKEKVAEIKAGLADIRTQCQALKETNEALLAKVAANNAAYKTMKPLIQEIASLQAENKELVSEGKDIMKDAKDLVARLKEAREKGQVEKMLSILDKMIETAQAYNINVNDRIACMQQILAKIED